LGFFSWGQKGKKFLLKKSKISKSGDFPETCGKVLICLPRRSFTIRAALPSFVGDVRFQAYEAKVGLAFSAVHVFATIFVDDQLTTSGASSHSRDSGYCSNLLLRTRFEQKQRMLTNECRTVRITTEEIIRIVFFWCWFHLEGWRLR
jgi:hypothetical protein